MADDIHVHITAPPAGGTIAVTNADGKVTTITITPALTESAVNGVSAVSTVLPGDLTRATGVCH